LTSGDYLHYWEELIEKNLKSTRLASERLKTQVALTAWWPASAKISPDNWVIDQATGRPKQGYPSLSISILYMRRGSGCFRDWQQYVP